MTKLPNWLVSLVLALLQGWLGDFLYDNLHLKMSPWLLPVAFAVVGFVGSFAYLEHWMKVQREKAVTRRQTLLDAVRVAKAHNNWNPVLALALNDWPDGEQKTAALKELHAFAAGYKQLETDVALLKEAYDNRNAARNLADDLLAPPQS